MPICVVIFKDRQSANDLIQNLNASSSALVKCNLIKPSASSQENKNSGLMLEDEFINPIKSLDIDSVKLLSPKLSRELRQKTMAFWLMPFGFITGLAFTKMTGLKTFANMGFDQIGESLIGGLLGMGSGLIGSYVASSSVNPDKEDDISILRKLNKDGLWMLLLETPLDIDLPWQLLQESKNEKIVKLNNNQ